MKHQNEPAEKANLGQATQKGRVELAGRRMTSERPRTGFRKILYATDLSSCSRQAFGPAASLARRYAAELHLFHAVVLYGQGPYDPMFAAPAADGAYQAAAEAAADRLAGLARSSCAGGTKLVIAQRMALRPAAAILEYAEEAGVDLIVMGTHGRSGPGRLLLGSVAEEVTRHAHCPVLLMRELADGKNRPVPLVRHIVVPIDFSLPAREAMIAAGEIAVRYGARLTLVHVIEERAWAEAYPDGGTTPAPRERVAARAERRLRGAAAALPPGVAYEIELRGGQPAAEIVAFAERTGADLVVMASRGLGGIERLVFGSTAEQVARSADAPVLIVHPKTSSEELSPGRN